MRHKNSDNQIINALSHLPPDLPQTFVRILSQYTEADDVNIGRQIFRWIAVAERPLTLEELQEAISITPLQESWDPCSSITNIKKAIGCCGNLICVDEEQQTVHFVHSSVEQYLVSVPAEESSKNHHIDLQQADADAGAICVTYLNFPVFNTRLARVPKTSVNATEMMSLMVQNCVPTSKFGNRIALRMLRQSDRTGKPVNRLLEEAKGDTEHYRQQVHLRQYSLRAYAEQYWLQHTKQRIDLKSERLWRLWRNLIEEADWRGSLSKVPWSFQEWKECSSHVARWVTEHCHCSLAQLMVNTHNDLIERSLPLLVEGATIRGHEELLEIILATNRVSQSLLDSALQSASVGGHLVIVERLLQEKANVNATAEYTGRTALQGAAERGHLAIVERLLQEKADINAAAAKFNGRTALPAAFDGGHLAVVERLRLARVEK